MNIGTKIKALREERRYSQKELGDRVGVSRVAIGNYERGDRIPAVDVAYQVARALGVSLSELMGDYREATMQTNIKIFVEGDRVAEAAVAIGDALRHNTFMTITDIEKLDGSPDLATKITMKARYVTDGED